MQEGLVTNAQLRASGVTVRQRQNRLDSGEWVRVFPSVVRMYWAEDSWMQRVRATALWLRRGASLSHWTAATINGLATQSRDTVDCVVWAQRIHARLPSWLRVARTHRPVRSEDVDGLPVTDAWRTLQDLVPMLDESELQRIVAAAVRDGLIKVPLTARQLASGIGRPDHGRLRAAADGVVRRMRDQPQFSR